MLLTLLRSWMRRNYPKRLEEGVINLFCVDRQLENDIR